MGAPYTQAQIGHLNQLPPPFVLLALAALVAALRGDDEGTPSLALVGAGRRPWFSRRPGAGTVSPTRSSVSPS